MFNTLEERLIVAADLLVDQGPGWPPREQAREFLSKICTELGPLGVTIKVNTVARIMGDEAIEFIHGSGLKCFLDLKLFDIGNTVENDAAWIAYHAPLILTVAERIKPAAFKKMCSVLPDTLVLPVGPLTDLDDEDFVHFSEPGRTEAVTRFFSRIWKIGAKGAICAPTDIKLAPSGFVSGATIVTPAVKPAWTLADDNTANALTPGDAIAAGSDAIVVGRGITTSKNMREAAERTLDEMHHAFAMRSAI